MSDEAITHGQAMACNGGRPSLPAPARCCRNVAGSRTYVSRKASWRRMDDCRPDTTMHRPRRGCNRKNTGTAHLDRGRRWRAAGPSGTLRHIVLPRQDLTSCAELDRPGDAGSNSPRGGLDSTGAPLDGARCARRVWRRCGPADAPVRRRAENHVGRAADADAVRAATPSRRCRVRFPSPELRR
jgi:hypothetical protein